MALKIASSLGPYHVTADTGELGEGVCRGRDSKLERVAALGAIGRYRTGSPSSCVLLHTGRDQIQVDCQRHRLVSSPVRVNLIARATGRTRRLEFGAKHPSCWIHRRRLEIHNRIEDATGTDELVHGLPAGLDWVV